MGINRNGRKLREEENVAFFNFQLPKELEDFRLRVKEFIRDEILPLEKLLEPDATRLEKEELKKLQTKAKEAGLFALGAPKKFGGQERSIFELPRAAEA